MYRICLLEIPVSYNILIPWNIEPGFKILCNILNQVQHIAVKYWTPPPPVKYWTHGSKYYCYEILNPLLFSFAAIGEGFKIYCCEMLTPPPSSDFLLQLLERGFKILNDTGHLPLTPSFLILNTCIQCMIIVKQSTHYKGHTTSFLLTRDQTMIAFTCMSWSIKGATHLCTITYVCITGQYSPRYLSRIIHWTQF